MASVVLTISRFHTGVKRRRDFRGAIAIEFTGIKIVIKVETAEERAERDGRTKLSRTRKKVATTILTQTSIIGETYGTVRELIRVGGELRSTWDFRKLMIATQIASSGVI